MGTDINIKKKIAVQEESVTITSDVNSINFTGAGITATPSGDDVIVNIPGSIGATVYYLNETISQAPYKEFSSIPTAAAEQTIATAVGVGATVTIQSFQTPSGVPNTTNIPAGLWQFYLHFSGTFGDSWDVYAEVYKRDLGGIETLLLTTDIIPTTALSAIPTMILTDGVFPASTVLTTDRIVVKVLATNTGVAGQTITFHTEGSTNYSVGTTTLNQIVPIGAVTNVTGTAPVVSSGGTTPAISMAQADSVTDGYLSSTDWNTFNNKADINIYSADGTLLGNRTVTYTGNRLLITGTDSGQVLTLDMKAATGSGNRYIRLKNTSGTKEIYLSITSAGASLNNSDSSTLQTSSISANNGNSSVTFVDGSTGINNSIIVDSLVTLQYSDGVDLTTLALGASGVSINSSYILPNADGIAGQFITTDGAGNLSWGTPTDTNIYNSNGTLSGNRTVTMSGNTLNFSGGNVGINQPTPTVPLHIKSTAIPSTNENIIRLEVSDAPTAYLAFNNAALTDGEFVPEVVGRQGASSTQSAIYQGGYIDVTQDSGTTPVTVFRSALASLTQVVTRPLFAFRNWSTTVMTILADGKVGIGTTTPSTSLHVRSTAVPSTGEPVARFDVSDGAGYLQIANATSTDGTFAPVVQGRQSGISTQPAFQTEGIIDVADDTGTTPVTAFKARLNTLTSVVTRPVFQFSNWSTNLMTILANGNVGIGTTTPAEKLEVSGKTKTTTFQMTTSPTAGYVLTSDASGNGTWTAPTSSSGRFGIADSAGAYTYYTTLSAAMTAASSGQTIEMFANVTESGNVTITLKDGVTVNGNGHTYTFSYSGSSYAMSFSGSNSSVITNMIIERTAGDYPVIFTNASGTLDLTNTIVKSNSATNAVILCDYLSGNIIGATIYNSSNGPGLYFNIGTGRAYNIKAYCSGGAGIYAFNSGITLFNCYGKSNSGYGILLHGATCHNSIGESTSGYGLQTYYGYNSTGISASGVGLYIAEGADCIGISTSSTAVLLGTGKYINITGISSSGWGITQYYGGATIINPTAISGSGYGMYFDYGNNQRVEGGYIYSMWNNAGGHALRFGPSIYAQVVNGVKLRCTNASANNIYQDWSVSCKLLNNTYIGGAGVSPTITNAMVNTQDVYGNIIE